MKKLAAFSILAGLAAGPVLADDECFVSMADWQPREAVEALAVEQGWTIGRIKIDDGCYEVKGRDADGREIELTLHPATLAILGSEDQFEDGEGREHD